MNKISALIALSAVLIAASAHAEESWYIFNERGTAVGRTNTEPKATGLELRGETAAKAPSGYDLSSIELKGGKVQQKPLTQEQKDLRDMQEVIKAEDAMIRNRMRKMAYDSLVAEGVKFRYLEEGV